jgi:ubiquinone/menaquinone biosynthesis C-methylase UbiE
MDAASYDRWYESPRGLWTGQREAALILEYLEPCPGEALLDVGCGTGFFTRALAASTAGPAVGVDIDLERVEYARRRDPGKACYEVADARALPFASASFELVVSIAAVCFIEDEVAAVREIVRVTRRRFAVGLLNRHSLLWLEQGRAGDGEGRGGMRWHTVRAARQLFRDEAVRRLRVRTAIQIPTGGRCARLIEHAWPSSLPFGGLILVVGDVTASAGASHGDSGSRTALRAAADAGD